MSRDAIPPNSDNRGIVEALLGDGRFLIMLAGICLSMAGGFALFQSATGHFLPHDVAFLGMTSTELCNLNECRVVHFMIHDRVSFGGVLIAIGALYVWLAEFPLKQGMAYAWWTLAISGAVGFASFLAYMGYGYLDSWHAAATLLLLPCFVVGMARSWWILKPSKTIRAVLAPAASLDLTTQFGWGRLCLLLTALGIVGAGTTITVVGMTTVFVPQDLRFMGLSVETLHNVNPRLVPLIAHDRAGFGGGLCSAGVALLGSIWCARPCRNLWQILVFVGVVGFATAIGIHFVIGYTDFVHLAPAFIGAATYGVGLSLSYRTMLRAND